MGTEQTIEIELTVTELSEAIGTQLILDGVGGPFSYLAGIAFDGMTTENDIVDILVEYLTNERAFDLDDDEIEQIEALLRDAYQNDD